MELARRHDVEPEAFFRDDAEEPRRREGLSGVEDLAGGAHGGHIFGGALPDRGLVVHVEGRAALARQIDQVASAHLHVAGGVDPVRDREKQTTWSVGPGAAGAARASAAAAAAWLAPEIEGGGGRLAAARHREARHEHPGPRRLAG